MTPSGVLTKTLALWDLVHPIEVVDLKLFSTGFVLKSVTTCSNQRRSLWSCEGKAAVFGVSTGGLTLTFSKKKAISVPVIGQLDKSEVVAVHVKKALLLTSLLIFKVRNEVYNG